MDAESKFIIGNNLPVLVNTITVELESRFKIYQSIRKEFIDEIKNVIKCGRPGTGMPYFLKKAYKEEKCYDTTFEDYDGSYRPVYSQKFLSSKQIEAVSIFISEVLQSKRFDKNYCEFFYEKGSKVCLNLKN